VLPKRRTKVKLFPVLPIKGPVERERPLHH